MGLYEFFLPEVAQAEHLRTIAASMGRQRRSRETLQHKTENDAEIGELALVLLGLIGTLVEKGVITREELVEHLRRVDALDGAADGKVDPAQVFQALGFAPPQPPPPKAPVPRSRRR